LHITLFYENVQGQMTEQFDVCLCDWFASLQLLDPFVYIATHCGLKMIVYSCLKALAAGNEAIW
jgi:hypothetical protein